MHLPPQWQSSAKQIAQQMHDHIGCTNMIVQTLAGICDMNTDQEQGACRKRMLTFVWIASAIILLDMITAIELTKGSISEQVISKR